MSKHKPVISVIVSLPGEEWRPMIGYAGMYSVSNLGRVASHCAGSWRNQNKIMSPGLKANGYLKVSVGPNANSKNIYVHRAVMLAFGPPPNGKTDVNHKDGNKLNNRLDNLEWNTRSENMQHAMRTGLWTSRGASNPMAKLTPANVMAIRSLRTQLKPSREIAKIFNVCRATIDDILAGRKWSHVA